ncbi:BQ2448_7106 [Microbotryum intermedium]|uniref:BQ2448_7106 protein n=1 Tax=Microbotryum intermedium TaxID=269621 RepID=A0A238FLZ8_9BASI|nr:BQ2448_7106 [Microbotryum intermedium]
MSRQGPSRRGTTATPSASSQLRQSSAPAPAPSSSSASAMTNNTITPRGRRVPRASVEAQAQAGSNLPTPRPTNLSKATRDTGHKRGRGGAWRKSLMGPSRGPRSRTLDVRQQAVAMPTQIALQALLDVGKRQDTGVGLKNRMALSGQDVKDYNAFRAIKEAYLSTASFLRPDALDPHYAPQLNDPSSPFNQLVRRANLVTFLYLVFSSGPDAEGNRRRDAAAKLTDAATNFLTLVVPNEAQIHDGVLAMLTGLRVQAYLSHLATSRERSAPSEFLGSPLSTYLSQEKLLDNRSAAIRFTTLQNDALVAIESTEADLEVLETQYKWTDLVQELRNYCENIADTPVESGRSDADSVDDEADADEGEEPVRRPTESKASPRGPQTPRATIVPKSLKKSAKKALTPVQTREETPSDVDELLSDSALANVTIESQSDVGRLDEEQEVEERLRYSSVDEGMADTRADEMESYETAATVEKRNVQAFRALEEGSKTFKTASSYQEAEQRESLELEKPTMAVQMRALQRELSHEQSTIDTQEEDDGSIEPLPTRAAQISLFLRDLTSELSTHEMQVEEETLEKAIAEFSDEDGENEEEEEDFKPKSEEKDDDLSVDRTPRPQRRDASVDDTATRPIETRLAFGQGNQLQRVPVDNTVARSLLDRQADAEKLRFDSQGGEDADEEDELESPRKTKRAATGSKGKGKGKGRGKQKEASVPAIEQSRGQVTRVRARTGSPVPEDEDSDRSKEKEREDRLGTVELEQERDRPHRADVNNYQYDPFFDEREFGGGNGSNEPEQETFAFDQDDAASSLDIQEVSAHDRKGKGKEKAQESSSVVVLEPGDEMTMYFESRRIETLDAQNKGVGTSSRSKQAASGSKKKTGRNRREASGGDEGFETDHSSVDDELRRRNRRAQRQIVDDESDRNDDRSRNEPDARSKQRSKKRSRVESDSDSSDANAPMRDFLKATHSPKRTQYEDVVLSDSSKSNNEDGTPSPPRCHNIYRQNRNAHGARIAWTYEEDRCLTEAMRHHQCRWSQIMALHGPQGAIDDKLKHRTSMSIRDRAVNLKVNLVKQRLRVPSYFKPDRPTDAAFTGNSARAQQTSLAHERSKVQEDGLWLRCPVDACLTVVLLFPSHSFAALDNPITRSFLVQVAMYTPSLSFVLLALTSAVSAIVAVGEPNPATPDAHTKQLEVFCKKFTSRCYSSLKTKNAGLHRCYWNTKDSVKVFCGEVKVVTEVINSTGNLNSIVKKTELPKDGKVTLPTHIVHRPKEVKKYKLINYTPKLLKRLQVNASPLTLQILKYTKQDTAFKKGTEKRLEGRVVRLIKAPQQAPRANHLWKVLA